MIDPPPARRIAGIPYLHPRNTPLALTFIVKSQIASSVDTASSSLPCMMPALLKSTFSLPNVCSAASIIFAASAAFATSAWTNAARPPLFSMAATVSCPPRSSMSATTTDAPSAANNTADSLPIPLPAPVISATFPSRRISLPTRSGGLRPRGPPTRRSRGPRCPAPLRRARLWRAWQPATLNQQPATISARNIAAAPSRSPRA